MLKILYNSGSVFEKITSFIIYTPQFNFEVLSGSNQCPNDLNVVYLAQDSMPLCYDEYVNKVYRRIAKSFNNVFDYNADGLIDLEETSSFLKSEKLGLILHPQNEKYLDKTDTFKTELKKSLVIIFKL